MARDELLVTVAAPPGGETLEAIFLGGETPHGALVAPPHPLYGGSIESPVVTELAYAASRAGAASLRFNWRGVGASAGRPSGEADDADADYGAALAHLAESVSGDLLACGYSFGSVAALRAALREPRAAGAVLVAPPPSYFASDALSELGRPCLILAGAHDEIAPPAELEERCAGLPHVELQVIEGADHFFMAGLGEIGRHAERWFAKGWGAGPGEIDL